MTSKLRIDLSHKTEGIRFSGYPPLNYLTAMHSCLSFILYESKLELSKLAKYELYTQRAIW